MDNQNKLLTIAYKIENMTSIEATLIILYAITL